MNAGGDRAEHEGDGSVVTSSEDGHISLGRMERQTPHPRFSKTWTTSLESATRDGSVRHCH